MSYFDRLAAIADSVVTEASSRIKAAAFEHMVTNPEASFELVNILVIYTMNADPELFTRYAAEILASPQNDITGGADKIAFLAGIVFTFNNRLHNEVRAVTYAAFMQRQEAQQKTTKRRRRDGGGGWLW